MSETIKNQIPNVPSVKTERGKLVPETDGRRSRLRVLRRVRKSCARPAKKRFAVRERGNFAGTRRHDFTQKPPRRLHTGGGRTPAIPSGSCGGRRETRPFRRRDQLSRHVTLITRRHVFGRPSRLLPESPLGPNEQIISVVAIDERDPSAFPEKCSPPSRPVYDSKSIRRVVAPSAASRLHGDGVPRGPRARLAALQGTVDGAEAGGLGVSGLRRRRRRRIGAAAPVAAAPAVGPAERGWWWWWWRRVRGREGPVERGEGRREIFPRRSARSGRSVQCSPDVPVDQTSVAPVRSYPAVVPDLERRLSPPRSITQTCPCPCACVSVRVFARARVVRGLRASSVRRDDPFSTVSSVLVVGPPVRWNPVVSCPPRRPSSARRVFRKRFLTISD